MGLDILPRAGANFRATSGAGNFKTKLAALTRVGKFHNLQNNQKPIVAQIQKYKRYIQVGGGLSASQRKNAFRAVKAAGKGEMSRDDLLEAKQIINYYNRDHSAPGAAAPKKKISRERIINRDPNAAAREDLINKANPKNRAERAEEKLVALKTNIRGINSGQNLSGPSSLKLSTSPNSSPVKKLEARPLTKSNTNRQNNNDQKLEPGRRAMGMPDYAVSSAQLKPGAATNKTPASESSPPNIPLGHLG